jgi:hypothetical protein
MEQRFTGEGSAFFDHIENAEKAYHKFAEWITEKNGQSEFWISNVTYDKVCHIHYKISSELESLGNCRHQCWAIKEFFKQLDGCMSVHNKVIISIIDDAHCWEKRTK